ncbi:hypothetical protein AAFM41_16635, partial [Klebsiella pneumoniae]
HDNQHYIDTGAVFGGMLTLVALVSRRLTVEGARGRQMR